ncbi:MAG: gliding motility-associated C-terminal domain-containing protein [Lewinellaceae bacterium]|nr:gliding motility-associated C-terminal domain-containing protein [Lewinellaceae bacterium]
MQRYFYYLFFFVFLFSIKPSGLFAQGDPDCSNAVVLCSNANISFNPTGGGAVNDFASANNNQGCLSTGERNTAWYYFEFNNTMPPNSQIEFTITPNNAADYDFALYGPGVSCGNLGNPVRCSYAAGSGPTGLGNGAADFSEGAGGNGWVAPLTVQPGQGFYLVIDNFSGNGVGFDMTWGGTAAPYLNCNANPSCNITLNFTPSYNVCSGTPAFQLQGTVTGLAATPAPTYSWSSPNGMAYLSSSSVANPTFTPPANVNSTFQYTLAVTQGTCMEMTTVTVTVAQTPVVAINGPTQLCLGSQITLNATPGFVSYSWSNGASGPNAVVTNPGPISVTVTNASGCQGTANYNVVGLPTPMPVISGPQQMCPNTQQILNAGPGYSSYQWSTGSTSQTTAITNPGTYQVTVTQNGCTGTASYTVFLDPGPTVFIFGDTYICPGGSADLSADAGFVSYNWSNGASGSDITVVSPGNYQVTITDANGCVATAAYQLQAAPPPLPVIFGDLAICTGSPATLDAGTSYSTYQWSEGSSSSIITVNTPGPYSVTVTDANGCTGSATANVTVAPDPVPSIAGLTAICPGQNTQLTAGAGYSSYLWSTGSNSPSIQVNQAGAYTVSVSDANGCIGQNTINVTVQAGPTPAITGPSEICPGASATLNAGAGYSSYLWSNGSGGATLNVSTQGTYGVTVTNAAGCMGTASFFVGVLPPPSPQISGNATYCEGSSTTLNAGSGYSSYAWSSGGSGPQVTVSQPGTYTVTVADNSGCTGTASVNVSSTPNPVPVIQGQPQFCEGTSTTLQANPGYASYSWSNGSSGPVLMANTAGMYILTVTDANGCQGTASQQVQAIPNPIPTISGATAFCQSGSTQLTASPGFSSYIWSNSQTNPTITANQAGNYSVTVTDGNGCLGFTSVNVQTYSNPSPVISGAPSICPGSNTVLSTANSYTQYSWSNGSTQANTTASAPGMYILTVTDANGCMGTAQFNVSLFNAPSPPEDVAMAFCQGASVTLQAPAGYASYQWGDGSQGSVLEASAAGQYSYTVTDNNGCIGVGSFDVTANALPGFEIIGGLSYCYGQSTLLEAPAGYASYLWNDGSTASSLDVSSPGDYSVQITDANGCSASETVSVAESPLPNANISGLQSFCTGGATSLSAQAGMATYAWSNGSNQPSISVGQPGTYGLTVTDFLGCPNSSSVSVSEIPQLEPTISGNLSYCVGQSTALDAGLGYALYSWSTGSAEQVIDITAPGLYSVTVQDANGCQGQASVEAVQHPLPVFSISGDTEYCAGDGVTLNATPGFAAYQWSNNATTASVAISTPGSYTLVVTDNNGCSDSATMDITEHPLPVPAITGLLSFCPEGSTTLGVNGAFGQYAWSTGNSGASIDTNQPGSYSVTVTDANGCSGSDSVELSLYDTPEPQISGILEFCAGTSTTLQANTGYTSYNWTTGAAGASVTINQPGMVGLSVIDNNGCQGETSVVVAENALPQPVVSGINYFCQGSSTTLDAGPGFASYAWTGNGTGQQINVSQAGTYTVTVADAIGCQGTASLTVTQAPNPAPQISGQLNFCPGTSTELSTGSNFASYLWSDGNTSTSIEVLQPGPYGLTVTNALGCTGQASVQVNNFTTNVPDISGNLSFCPGTSTSLAAEGGFSSYLWSTAAVGPSITVNAGGNYGLTVTDANGCQTTNAVSVSVFPVTPPAISGSNAFCAGGSVALSASPGYTVYNWSNGASVPDITVSSGGLYRVTVTDVNGCISSSSLSVVQNPLPQVMIGGSTSFCIGGFTTLNAGASYAQYQWSTGGATPSIQVNQAGPYALTVTDANGCVGSGQVSVTEDIELTPVISGALAYCPGGATTLDAGDGFQTYTWSNGSNGQSLLVQTPGSYSVTVTDASGCTGDTEVSVSVFPAPAPAISGLLEYCDGASTQLEATGGNFASYNWSTGAIEPEINVSQPGTYSLSITDVNGCQESATVVVAENPLPSFTISGGLSFCQGSSTALSATPGFAAYQWSNGLQTPAINVTAPGTYGLVVTNSFGCTSQQAVATTQIPQPQADAGSVQVINCYNQEVAIGGQGSSQGNNIQYQWQGPGITPSNANQQFPTVDVPGVYTLTVVQSVLGCASNPATVTVSDNTNAPVVLLEALDVLDCTTSTAVIDGTSSASGNAIVYQWYDGNLNLIGGATTSSLEVGEAGQYYLLVADTISGCSAMDSIQVNEDIAYPYAEAGQPQHLDCAVNEVTLDGGASQSGDIITYSWSTPSGNIISGGQSINPLVDEPGVYILTVMDTLNGCSNVDTVLVTQDVNVPQADAGQSQEIDCVNPTVVLTGTGSSGSQYSYRWAFGNAGNIIGNGLSLTAGQPGAYIFIVTNTDNGCTNTDQVQVTQNSAQPSALNLALDNPTCFGDSDGSVIIGGVTGGTPPFLYSFDDGPLSTQQVFLNLPAGNYPVLVQDALGCEFELMAQLEEGNDLMVALGPDLEAKLGEEAELIAEVNIPESEISSISWTAADSLSCYDCLRTAVIRPTNSGSYLVRVVDNNGCAAQDQLILFLNKKRNIFVPNVFSPNGDGANDVFMAFAGPDVVKIRSFLVFNRWGESVFEVYGPPPNDPNYGWDGTYRGELYNGAVFAWFAEVEFVDGVVELFKGDVTLLR